MDDLDPQSDAALAVRARSGDARAFADLLRRHSRALRGTAIRYGCSPADADDVAQEAAWKAWSGLGSLRQPEQVRAWLVRITVREAIATASARRAEHQLSDDAGWVHGPEHVVERFDLRDAVRAALRAMPPQQAQAWVLRQVDGLSYAEIADRLEQPESTVRSWLVVSRRRVQASIDECCPGARPRPVSVTLPAGADRPPVVDPVERPVAAAAALVPAPPTAPRSVPRPRRAGDAGATPGPDRART